MVWEQDEHVSQYRHWGAVLQCWRWNKLTAAQSVSLLTDSKSRSNPSILLETLLQQTTYPPVFSDEHRSCSPTGLKLLESVLFDSVPSVYDGTGVNVKIGLLENVLLPRNQQRDKKKKKKSPHHSRERAENKNNSPRRRKIKHTKNKINQEASESSVETTTFIFPLQLCTIRLYTSKAVMLSSQRSLCVCVCGVCVCPRWSCSWRGWGRGRLPSRRPSLRWPASRGSSRSARERRSHRHERQKEKSC